jgi:hypothetical protein
MPASTPLSAAEHARLNSFMRDIAAAARGQARDVGAGKWTYGSKGAFCLYSDGHYCDWSADGPTKRGQGGLEQIRHLHPDVDPVEFARSWLASHPGSGDFVPHADKSESDADDVGRNLKQASPIVGDAVNEFLGRLHFGKFEEIG